MPTATTNTRLLTEPPDMEWTYRQDSWAPWTTAADTRFIMFTANPGSDSARGRYSLYQYGPTVSRMRNDIRYYSHGNRPQIGVWDRQESAWADIADYLCDCHRDRIRAGELVAGRCGECDGAFTQTLATINFDYDEYVFCGRSCRDQYAQQREREELRGQGFMRNYSWKPRPNFLRASADPDAELYFGFELELPSNHARDLSTAVYDGPGQEESVLYCKEDGSIAGAEVVSHPMTHTYFRQDLDLAGLFGRNVGRYVSGEPGTGYGLHVHVSRKGFKSQAHALRWLLLIYRNSAHMARLSRRTNAQWSSFRDADQCEDKARIVGVGDRYTAVNAQNEETFEVRCFRSTYTEQEFRAAVDFCHASVVYTRGLNNSTALAGDGLTWDKFRAWVDERSEYEHLSRELTRVDSEPLPELEEEEEEDQTYDEDNYDGSYDSDDSDRHCTCAGCTRLRQQL